MDICLLTAHAHTHATTRLLAEFQQRQLAVTVLAPTQARVVLPEQGPYFTHTLNRLSSVDIADGYLFSLMQLKRWGRQVNPWSVRSRWWDKTRQSLWLQQQGIPTLPLFAHRGPLSPEDGEWRRFKAETSYGEGWVLKVNRGQKGIGVHFFTDESSLFAWLETLWRLGDQDFFIQPRLKLTRELRFTLLGQRPWAVLEREGERANFAQGGLAQEVTPSRELAALIENFCSVSADYLSIDVLESAQGLFVTDLNTTPGFQQLESVTGRNFAANLVEYLLKS